MHVFEREPSLQGPPANSIDMRHIPGGGVGDPPPAAGVLYDGATGLPSHFTHVEHKRGECKLTRLTMGVCTRGTAEGNLVCVSLLSTNSQFHSRKCKESARGG